MNAYYILLTLLFVLFASSWIIVLTAYKKHFKKIDLFYLYSISRNSFTLSNMLVNLNGVKGLLLYIGFSLLLLSAYIFGLMQVDYPVAISLLMLLFFDQNLFIFPILLSLIITLMEKKKRYSQLRRVGRNGALFMTKNSSYRLFIEEDPSIVSIDLNSIRKVDHEDNKNVVVSNIELEDVKSELTNYYKRYGYMNSAISNANMTFCLDYKNDSANFKQGSSCMIKIKKFIGRGSGNIS